jgi:uncharacterized membrane protein (UPF0127 family)
MKPFCVILLLALLAQSSAWASDIVLHIGQHEIRAKIANTAIARKQGLMHTSRLCDKCGMLFVFATPGKYRFWMKNTPAPLSIAFISATGRIQQTDEMEANSVNLHTAKSQALYVLEMNRGWFAAHSVNTNQYVLGLQKAPKGE